MICIYQGILIKKDISNKQKSAADVKILSFDNYLQKLMVQELYLPLIASEK